MGCDSNPVLHSTRKLHQILYVGSTDKRKNFEFLIQLLKILPETYTLIHGGKPNAKQLKLLKQLKLEHRYQSYTNLRPQELSYLYATSHLCIVPSLYEGLSLVALEARYHQCPLLLQESIPAFEILKDDPGTFPFNALAPHALQNAKQIIEKIPCEDIVWENAQKYSWNAIAKTILTSLTLPNAHTEYLSAVAPETTRYKFPSAS